MRDLFTTIAPKYDFITRAFSFGMDRGWKRMAVSRADLPTGGRVLDLACGTGDFGKLARAQCAGAQIVAADLTESMLRLANVRDSACADAASFDKKVSRLDLRAGTVSFGAGIHTSSEALDQPVQQAGIQNVVFHDAKGLAHEWQTWRYARCDFAPRLFQQKK